MTMKRYSSLVTLLLLSGAVVRGEYKNTELLFEERFDAEASLEPWSRREGAGIAWDEKGGPDGSGAVVFTSVKPEMNMISLSLDAKKLSGIVRLEAEMKGSSLTQGTINYHGTKVMLPYQKAGKWEWPELKRTFGDFDWTVRSQLIYIPVGAEKLHVKLGIENATGVLRVGRVSIYRCEETDAPVALREPGWNQEAAAIPRGPGKGAKYRGVMSGEWMRQEEIETLRKWNVNLIRYQLRPLGEFRGRKINTPEKYLAWIDDEIVKLDKMLEHCKGTPMKVVIDLHAGYSTEITQAMSNVITDGEETVRVLKQAWTKLATHYKGNPHVYGYDLLNEPRWRGQDIWRPLAQELVNTIRAIDPDTPIIIETSLRNYVPFDGENIVHTIHPYHPMAFSHQGVGRRRIRWSYPGEIDGEYWDKEQIRLTLQHAIRVNQEHGVPIYVGEFAVPVWARGADAYLRDLIEIFEEYGWDWTYHAFREWPVWSAEHEYPLETGFNDRAVVPSEDNPRKRVLLEAFRKNGKDAE